MRVIVECYRARAVLKGFSVVLFTNGVSVRGPWRSGARLVELIGEEWLEDYRRQFPYSLALIIMTDYKQLCTDQHPITPPPELIEDWIELSRPSAVGYADPNKIATIAAHWSYGQAIKELALTTMTSIATFKVPVSFCLDSKQIKEAQTALNTYHLGDAECNHLNPETMQYEPKYPEKETEEFKKAVGDIKMTRTVFLTVGLDHKGGLSIL